MLVLVFYCPPCGPIRFKYFLFYFYFLSEIYFNLRFCAIFISITFLAIFVGLCIIFWFLPLPACKHIERTKRQFCDASQPCLNKPLYLLKGKVNFFGKEFFKRDNSKSWHSLSQYYTSTIIDVKYTNIYFTCLCILHIIK